MQTISSPTLSLKQPIIIQSVLFMTPAALSDSYIAIKSDNTLMNYFSSALTPMCILLHHDLFCFIYLFNTWYCYWTLYTPSVLPDCVCMCLCFFFFFFFHHVTSVWTARPEFMRLLHARNHILMCLLSSEQIGLPDQHSCAKWNRTGRKIHYRWNIF